MAEKNKGVKGQQEQSNKGTRDERKIAYIMFLNLYWEWMDTEEEERLIVMEEAVERLGLKKSEQYKKWNDLVREDDIDRELATYYLCDDTAEENDPISTSTFDEYVTDVYLSFFDKFNGFQQSKNFGKDVIDAFVSFMQKSWEYEEQRFERVKEKFLERVFKEWDEKSANLTGQALDKFVSEEKEKSRADYYKLRKYYDERRTVFRSMEDMFFRLAKLARLRYAAERRSGARLANIDDEKLDELLDKTKEGLEEQAIFHDGFDRFLDKLNDTDKKIVCLRAKGYKLEEIAQEVGLNTSTVSRRLSKIKNAK